MLHSQKPQNNPKDEETKKEERDQKIKEHKRLMPKGAREIAKKHGYKETSEGKFNSHGQPKFIKDGSIITPDADGHNGGVERI